MTLHETPAQNILSGVALAFGERVEELTGRTRVAKTFRARAPACLLLRQNLNWSYPRVASLMNRDHTTVIDAVKRAKNDFANDAHWAALYDAADVHAKRITRDTPARFIRSPNRWVPDIAFRRSIAGPARPLANRAGQ